MKNASASPAFGSSTGRISQAAPFAFPPTVPPPPPGASPNFHGNFIKNSQTPTNAFAASPRPPSPLFLPDGFSPRSWQLSSTEVLLAATDSLDQLCHAVVASNSSFRENSISAEIRRLALTVAVFERSLFAYALAVSRQKNPSAPSPRHASEESEQNNRANRESLAAVSLLPIPVTVQAPPSVFLRPSVDGILNSLNKRISPSPPNPPALPPSSSPSLDSLSLQFSPVGEVCRLSSHQPAGMVCLIKLLTRQLNSTRMILQCLDRECASFPIFALHLMKKIGRAPRRLLAALSPLKIFAGLSASAAAALGYKIMKILYQASLIPESPLADLRAAALQVALRVLRSPAITFLASFLPAGTFPLLWACLSFLAPSSLFSLFSSVVRHRSGFLTIPGFFYFLYRRSLFQRKKQLKILHSRLGFLLRLWHICFSQIQNTNAQSSQFALTAVASSSDLDSSTGRVPISRWMLELVPPELDASFWYGSNQRLSWLKFGLDCLYCSVEDWHGVFGERAIGFPYLFARLAFYAVNPQLAAVRASAFMSNPDVRVVKFAWGLLDSRLYRRFVVDFLPALGLSPGFAVCRQIDLVELEDQRIPGPRKRSGSDSGLPADSLLKILLLSSRPLDISVNFKFRRVSPALPGGAVRNLRALSSPVIIYLHGGGFITDFRAAHLHFLQRWAECGAPILYVDYSTDAAYPSALNECFDLYRWVAEGRLGLTATKILLAGDSTGGNLAAGVVNRAILDKIRVPDAVLLAYPILNLKLAPTPSRSLYMMDAVLPMNLLLHCRALYLPTHCDADSDPCLSPVVASDSLIKHWPPCDLLVGSFDPFIDDSVDFAHRLAACGVPCRLKVFDGLPHSFLDLALFLPEAESAVQLAAKWIKQQIGTRQ